MLEVQEHLLELLVVLTWQHHRLPVTPQLYLELIHSYSAERLRMDIFTQPAKDHAERGLYEETNRKRLGWFGAGKLGIA